MKTHNFQGELTDISAKKEALVQFAEVRMLGNLDIYRREAMYG